MSAPAPELLTVSEVTALLRISRDTVERMVRRGQLTAYRLPSGHPRFRREDALALLVRDTGR